MLEVDFEGFCDIMRERSGVVQSTDTLLELFKQLHISPTGMADRDESLCLALATALGNMHARAIDLLRSWDDDNSGTVDKREFRKAMKAMGFQEESNTILDALFDKLDIDGSGKLEYKELADLVKRGTRANTQARRLSAAKTATLSRAASLKSNSMWQPLTAQATMANVLSKGSSSILASVAERAVEDTKNRSRAAEEEEAAVIEAGRLLEDAKEEERLRAIEEEEARQEAQRHASEEEAARRHAAFWAAVELAKQESARETEAVVRRAAEDAVHKALQEATVRKMAEEEVARQNAQDAASLRATQQIAADRASEARAVAEMERGRREQQRLLQEQQSREIALRAREERMRAELLVGWQQASQLEEYWRRSVHSGLPVLQQHSYCQWQEFLDRLLLHVQAWQEVWREAWPNVPPPQLQAHGNPSCGQHTFPHDCSMLHAPITERGHVLSPITPSPVPAPTSHIAALSPLTATAAVDRAPANCPPPVPAPAPVPVPVPAYQQQTVELHQSPMNLQCGSQPLSSSVAPSQIALHVQKPTPAESPLQPIPALLHERRLQELIDAADEAASSYQQVRTSAARSLRSSCDALGTGTHGPCTSQGHAWSPLPATADNREVPTFGALTTLHGQLAEVQTQLKGLASSIQGVASSPQGVRLPLNLVSRNRLSPVRKLGRELRDSSPHNPSDWRDRVISGPTSEVMNDILRENEELKKAYDTLSTEKRALSSHLAAERAHASEAQAREESVRAEFSATTASLQQRLREAEAEQVRLCALMEGKLAVISNRVALAPVTSSVGLRPPGGATPATPGVTPLARKA